MNVIFFIYNRECKNAHIPYHSIILDDSLGTIIIYFIANVTTIINFSYLFDVITLLFCNFNDEARLS